jgi:hypothetical protein
MSSIVKAALILSAAIIVGCFVFRGVYSTGRLAAGTGVFVINRFTGAVTLCGGGFCRHQIKGQEANPYSEFVAPTAPASDLTPRPKWTYDKIVEPAPTHR